MPDQPLRLDYVIFSDRALVEMATFFPLDEAQFLAVDGVGEARLARYGAAFLNVIREHCQARGWTPKLPAAGTTPMPMIRPPIRRRFHDIGEQFAAGQTVEAITARHGSKRKTVIENLAQFHEAGGQLDPERVLALSRLSEADRSRVLAAFERLGMERLAPVHESLGGAIEYDELQLLRLYRRCCERGAIG